MIIFSVDKGKHKFYPRFPELSDTSVSFIAKFDINCLYKLKGVDHHDINKLFGITSLFIHKNSYRFGWRAEEDKIRIFAYWYNRGIRGWHDMGLVNPNESNEYVIHGGENYFMFKLNDTEFFVEDTEDWCDFLTFESYPYFGGDKSAPHSMDIYIWDLD
jgi:hypothetical protein